MAGSMVLQCGVGGGSGNRLWADQVALVMFLTSTFQGKLSAPYRPVYADKKANRDLTQWCDPKTDARGQI